MNKRSSHVALKYSAAKLHEKGILLSIDGLPSNQFKNIQFEIVPVIAPVPGSSSSADQHPEQQVKQPALGQCIEAFTHGNTSPLSKQNFSYRKGPMFRAIL